MDPKPQDISRPWKIHFSFLGAWLAFFLLLLWHIGAFKPHHGLHGLAAGMALVFASMVYWGYAITGTIIVAIAPQRRRAVWWMNGIFGAMVLSYLVFVS